MSFFSELNPEMDNYLEQHTSQESPLLAKLREETYKDAPQSHMISGIQQGRFLATISKMLSPKRILELGTFTGYATLCMAEGLAKDGKIITLDINEELSYIPKKYWSYEKFTMPKSIYMWFLHVNFIFICNFYFQSRRDYS